MVGWLVGLTKKLIRKKNMRYREIVSISLPTILFHFILVGHLPISLIYRLLILIYLCTSCIYHYIQKQRQKEMIRFEIHI
ncbi:hypothetical protein J3Q64DRAFT_1773958 [Phycomyces blakesleeanus]|uniref:Uncharacterized protein n=1 Tax=Phycomyces blakesleeanus TaxID=4837 RepID=A0ABR3AMP6_PHYBL